MTKRAGTQGGRREEMVGRTGGGKHYSIHQNRSIHASLFIQEALLRKMNRIGRDLRNHLTQAPCNALAPFKISLPNGFP